MTIEITYRFEDIREAFDPPLKPGGKRNRDAMWGRIALCIAAAFWISRIIFGHRIRWPAEAAPPQDVLLTTLLPLAPPMLVLYFSVMSLFFRTPQLSSIGEMNKKHWIIPLTGAVAGVAIAVIILTLLNENLVYYWHPSRSLLVIIALGPWFLILAFVRLMSKRRNILKTFRNRGFQSKVVVQFESETVTFADEWCERKSQWSYFTRVRETEHLFLLYTVYDNFHIVPKRAFPDEPSLTQMRSLFQSQVKNCQFIVTPTGFPIAPMVPVPVLPA